MKARLPRKSAAPDFILAGSLGDSVFILSPRSAAAKAWADENISPDGYQPYVGRILIEHRYIGDILIGIRRAGLTVQPA